MRRIRHGNSRRQIALLIVVPAWTMISRAGELESDIGNGIVADPLVHVLDHLVELRTGVESECRTPEYGIISRITGGRGLIAIDLPWRREERPAQPICHGQVRFDSPGILSIKLVPVKAIVPRDRCAGLQYVAALVVVVVTYDIGSHAQHPQHRVVILKG